MSEPESRWDDTALARIGEAFELARAEEKRHRDAAITEQVAREAALAEMLLGELASHR